MKKLFVTLLLCYAAHANGQSIRFDLAYPTYRAYTLPVTAGYDAVKTITGADTVFKSQAGIILLTTNTLTVDGLVYTITGKDSVNNDNNYFIYQTLTLSGGVSCMLTRYPNYALMNVTLYTMNNSIRYYIY